MTTDRITIEQPSTNGYVPAGWLGIDFETGRNKAGYDLLGRTLEEIAGYMQHAVLFSAALQGPISPPSRLWLKKGVWPVVEDLIVPSMLMVRGDSIWNPDARLLSALGSVASGRAGDALKVSAQSKNFTIFTGSEDSIQDSALVSRISLNHGLGGEHQNIRLTFPELLSPPTFLAIRPAGAFDDPRASFMVMAPATWIEEFVEVLVEHEGPLADVMSHWPVTSLNNT